MGAYDPVDSSQEGRRRSQEILRQIDRILPSSNRDFGLNDETAQLYLFPRIFDFSFVQSILVQTAIPPPWRRHLEEG